jgi:hypothetical protein
MISALMPPLPSCTGDLILGLHVGPVQVERLLEASTQIVLRARQKAVC